MSGKARLYPGSIPENETTLPDDPEFSERCMAVLADDAKKLGWKFGKSMLTRSDEWGLVWRVDIERPDMDWPLRMAVWWRSPEDGYGDGYGVAYLGPPKEPFR